MKRFLLKNMTPIKKEWLDWAKFIAIMVFVCALAIFIFMKWLEFKYEAEFLMQPCDLCRKLNPTQSRCIGDCFITKKFIEGAFYPEKVNTTKILDTIEVIS